MHVLGVTNIEQLRGFFLLTLGVLVLGVTNIEQLRGCFLLTRGVRVLGVTNIEQLRGCFLLTTTKTKYVLRPDEWASSTRYGTVT